MDKWFEDGFKLVEDKQKIVIIGATGTLGTEVLKRFNPDKYEIHGVSRGEHKQQIYKKLHPKVKFHICDIRDRQSLGRIIKGAHLVFLFAALKHVDICEENPIECLYTNTLGVKNVADVCVAYRVKRCVFSSTDKAVDPISTYGYAKAMSEKILHHYNRMQNACRFVIFRWGNIIDSQGSVIPFFIESMRQNKPIHLTDPKMTRFFIQINVAVDFMMKILSNKNLEFEKDRVYVPPMIRSSSVVEIIELLNREIRGDKPMEIVQTGVRLCEKLSEQLVSIHDEEPINSNTHGRMNQSELKEMLSPLMEFKK